MSIAISLHANSLIGLFRRATRFVLTDSLLHVGTVLKSCPQKNEGAPWNQTSARSVEDLVMLSPGGAD